MPASTSPKGFYQMHAVSVSEGGTESCGSSDGKDLNGTIFINCSNGYIGNIQLFQKGQKGPAQYGISLGGGSNCTLENIALQTNTDASSTFVKAGVSLHDPDGTFLKNVNVWSNGNGSGGPLWLWDSTSWFDGGGRYILRGAVFEGCNFDSSLTLANLPAFPAAGAASETNVVRDIVMWCSDCTTAVPGTVMSAYATATAPTTNPSTTLHFTASTGIPSAVANGWKIIGATNPFSISGTVSGTPNYAAGTLTASAAPGVGQPVNTGDVITFTAPGGGTNKVPLRWYGRNGIGWVVTV